ncbi:MAG TPA: cupredoxin domain-containing protein [Actinomycetota bacterium]|nr:cupredoxin domain-containing protein [Actinomycetota bacterium]
MLRLLMLVLCTVLLAACGGGEEPAEPPVTVTDTATETPSSPSATATGDAIEVEAENVAFETDSIEAPAGSTVAIEFKNRDSVPHNMAFYTDESASEEIFQGETITGPDAEVVYTFDAPAEAGSYFFRCDVHPTMNGTFTVS